MSSRLRYQDLRGLTRNFSLALPANASQVHLTSLAVNGLPSCHSTPWRKWKVSATPVSSHDQSLARSGTIEARLFCATCWSKTTRLLKTPISGIPAAIVDSSWIDMLAGLAKPGICRMPPGFCADAVAATNDAAASRPAAQAARSPRVISVTSLGCGSWFPLVSQPHESVTKYNYQLIRL